MDDYFGLFVIRTEPSKPKSITTEFNSSAISPSIVKEIGNKAWKALHTAPKLTKEWLESWETTVPKGCSCREGYDSYCLENPPVYGEGLSTFKWGWNLHNFINRKLNVPEMSFIEALKLWRPDLLTQLPTD